MWLKTEREAQGVCNIDTTGNMSYKADVMTDFVSPLAASGSTTGREATSAVEV